MLKDGDPMSTVMTRAKNKNGWNRAKTREMLFGSNY